jgi:hypothetical protein
MANVDRPLDSDVIRIQNPDQFAPVDLINQASPSLRFRYVERPGGRSKIIRTTTGSLQMLLRITPPLDPSLGPPRLHIVPHHFSPAQTLVPRLPQEKMLDGTTFSDLQLAPPVSDRHVWIVWADLPSSAASIESGDPVTLGQAMFTGHRRKTPIQLLLIIGAQPAAAASPAQP